MIVAISKHFFMGIAHLRLELAVLFIQNKTIQKTKKEMFDEIF